MWSNLPSFRLPLANFYNFSIPFCPYYFWVESAKAPVTYMSLLKQDQVVTAGPLVIVKLEHVERVLVMVPDRARNVRFSCRHWVSVLRTLHFLRLNPSS